MYCRPVHRRSKAFRKSIFSFSFYVEFLFDLQVRSRDHSDVSGWGAFNKQYLDMLGRSAIIAALKFMEYDS